MWQKRLLELNQVAQGSTPAQLRERLEADIAPLGRGDRACQNSTPVK